MIEEVDVLDMLENHGVDLTHIRAWVPCYFPFIMGGSVWHAGGATVPCERPVQIGEFFVCLIEGPGGMTAVVELTSGGVVGETMEAVRRDIEEGYGRGDVAMMRKQVADAREYLKRGFTTLSVDEFWERQRRAREKKRSVR